jgi:glycosyltransferase involved in cell wall biosynthesis
MPLQEHRKVAHLTSVHHPADTRIAYRECYSLARAGYDVVLIAAGEPPALPEGVRYIGVPRPRNRFERMSRTIWNVYVAARREHADVYHFHDPELMGIGLLLRAQGARVVFDVHEDIPSDIAEKGWIVKPLRRPLAMLSQLVLRAFQRGYSAIVAATPAIARRFPHKHTVVVCNYPRLEELPQGGTAQFSDRPRAVAYLGGITRLRCIEEIVEAMDLPQLADAQLMLAGRFDSEHLEAEVRSMPGFRRVNFIGQCPRSQVASFLSNARAGLLLFRPAGNHDEAMPTKLFEYLGGGLPVIISDTLQCSALVREHDCGLVVDAADPNAIAQAITFMIDNPGVAQAMGERGRRLVSERYQWTSEAIKLTNLYAEIA